MNEVDKRVSNQKKKLHERSIHSELIKYCEVNYLRNDYSDTVFEASKGLVKELKI